MDRAKTPLIFLSAGEVSGDVHGARLARALKRRGARLIGIAGPQMREAGVECLIPMEEFQVMGFIDVVKALPKLLRLFRQVKRLVLKSDPDVIVTIDYPGFHLRLAKMLWKRGHRARRVHFICPSVWAWGKRRIPLMAKIFDHMIAIFPFEKECFGATSLPVSYAGNPLVEKVVAAEPGETIAIYPGSRKKEIERNLPLQLEVAERFSEKVVISAANLRCREWIAALAPNRTIEEGMVAGARMAIATSGTITLELALAGVPTVVTYAIRPLDLFIAQKIFRISLPFYALPNIVAGEEVFPEHFGKACTFEKICSSVARVLEGPEMAQKKCKKVAHALGNAPTDESLTQGVWKV